MTTSTFLFRLQEKGYLWIPQVNLKFRCSSSIPYHADSKVVATFVKDHFPYHTIRTSSCRLLVPKPTLRCDHCSAHRKNLNSMLHRHLKSSETDSSHPESHTNYRFLGTPEKHEQLQRLRQKARVLRVALQKNEREIGKSNRREGYSSGC